MRYPYLVKQTLERGEPLHHMLGFPPGILASIEESTRARAQATAASGAGAGGVGASGAGECEWRGREWCMLQAQAVRPVTVGS